MQAWDAEWIEYDHAIAWICLRDWSRVGSSLLTSGGAARIPPDDLYLQIDAFLAVWRLDSNPSSSEAHEQLMVALERGGVRAKGRLPPSKARQIIDPEEWIDLTIIATKEDYLATERAGVSRGVYWRKLIFCREDVLREWPHVDTDSGLEDPHRNVDSLKLTTAIDASTFTGVITQVTPEIEIKYIAMIADAIAADKQYGREEDQRQLQELTGKRFPREQVRELRRKHAPEAWQTGGRRPKSGT